MTAVCLTDEIHHFLNEEDQHKKTHFIIKQIIDYLLSTQMVIKHLSPNSIFINASTDYLVTFNHALPLNPLFQCSEIKEFKKPDKAYSYMIGLITIYIVSKGEFPRTSRISCEDYKQFIIKCFGSQVGEYYDIEKAKLFKNFELISFIECCIGYKFVSLKKVCSLEKLKNHIYICKTKIPYCAKDRYLEMAKNECSIGLRKFVYGSGSYGMIVFYSKPKQSRKINKWRPYYVAKIPNSYEAYIKMIKHEIEINRFICKCNISKGAIPIPNCVLCFGIQEKHIESSDKTVILADINTPFEVLFLEFQPGTPLTIFTQSINCNEEYIRSIFTDITQALNGFHENNMIYSDLYPMNIIVYATKNNELHAKLLDFGSAFFYKAEPPMKKLTYSSPESFDTTRKYNGKSDIFSIGLNMLQAISKFHQEACTMKLENQNIVCQYLIYKLPIIQISVELIDIIEWCLCLKPEERPTCKEILSHPFFTSKGLSRNYIANSELSIDIRKRSIKKSIGIIATLRKYNVNINY